ncbi:hypothetical protein F511_16356 [Dorcoceras hygrometricum]|uniref:Uncharacterized protein n=1 Tax=Dorcoceras hygrometricum TaxID=472368 RepID=A0A2Z7AKK3_9LAMI|nr:hypothetical protein F511_16356 [Dorcoceras hygrometricum]
MIQRRRDIITGARFVKCKGSHVVRYIRSRDAVVEEGHKQVLIIKEETSWEGNQLGAHSVQISLEYSRAAQNEVQIRLEQL